MMSDDDLIDVLAEASLKATIAFANRDGLPVPKEITRPFAEIPDVQKIFCRDQAKEALAILRSQGYEIVVTKKD